MECFNFVCLLNALLVASVASFGIFDVSELNKHRSTELFSRKADFPSMKRSYCKGEPSPSFLQGSYKALVIEPYYPKNYLKTIQKDYRNRTESSKKECNNEVHVNSDHFVEKQSTCPFHWKIDHDKDRIPEILWKAEGTCEEPRSKPVDHVDYDDEKFSCEPIKYTLLVYRKVGCEAGNYQYRLDTQEIIVGYVEAYYFAEDSDPADGDPSWNKRPD